MIDIVNVNVGDVVIRKKDGQRKTIEHFCHGHVRLLNEGRWYSPAELDYAEPEKPLESAPTAETKREPKRVEVEWETKRVPSSVLLRMTAAEAEGFADFICNHDLMNKLQDDVRDALAEQEATHAG